MQQLSEVNDLVEHLFRHEAGKLISVLTGIFGSHNLIVAEDIVQDTLVEAISKWTYQGVPDNHVGWLYTVAKNKAFNALKRNKYHKRYISEKITGQSAVIHNHLERIDEMSEDRISDDQLRMMFMCCHPSLSEDSQVALILKTLCGFSIQEIAKAFLTNNENINKRLVRARKLIREHDIPFVLPKLKNLEQRVDAVLEAIYLLFNEGYSASTGDSIIREDLCMEAIRLIQMIINHPLITDKSNAMALLALMLLNTSRFKARVDENGGIHTLVQQDRLLWDIQMMEKGFAVLKMATQGEKISKYHLLAGISAYHCSAKDYASTNWNGILSLYEKLLSSDSSPMIIMNYAIVLFKTGKLKLALQKLNAIKDHKSMKSNHFYYSIKSEILVLLGKMDSAKITLERAIELAPLQIEKNLLSDRYKNYFK